MLRCGAPFGTRPVRPSQPALWSFRAGLALRRKSPSGLRVTCQALDGWGGQPSPVRAPGNDVMPFDISQVSSEEQAGSKSVASSNNGSSSDAAAAAAAAEAAVPMLTQTSHQDSPAWEAWLQVFANMDKKAEEQEFLKAALKDAVRCEDYGRAAAVKQELAAVQAADAVAAVQRELAAALQEERYSDAAKLRDQGMAWMQGWWAGQAEQDPVGHLLHVAPEFGRYTGRVYSARDLAELSGWREGGSGLQQLRAALQSSGAGTGAGRDEHSSGSPAMEVFLVQDEAQGGFVHQVVSLLGGPPDAKAATSSGDKFERAVRSRAQLFAERTRREKRAAEAVLETPDEDIGSVASILGLGTIMRLTISVSRDGSTMIKVAPVSGTSSETGSTSSTGGKDRPQTTMSKFNDWEAEEAAATLRALAGLDDDDDDDGAATSSSAAAADSNTSSSGSSSSSTASSSAVKGASRGAEQDDDEEDELTATMRELASEPLLKGSDPSSSSDTRDDDTPSRLGSPTSIMRQYNPMEGETMIELSHQEYEALFGRDELSEQMKAAESAAASASPAAAADKAADMVVDVPAARAVDLDATVSADDHDSDDGAVIAFDADTEQFTELHRSPARLQQQSVDGFVLQLLKEGYKEPGSRSTVAADTDDTAQLAIKFEVLMPVGQMTAQGKAEAAISLIAERVARVQAEQLGRGMLVDAAALQTGLQAVLGSLTAGKAAEVLIPAQSALDLEREEAQQESADSPHREVKYRRVASDPAARSDPFTGLYIGAFGPHGPEVMQLSRVVQEGEEWVQAVKVTGDNNVPAGTVSFKAKIGRKHKLSTTHVYPEELGVMGRYKGQGRVAAAGYTKPKWVEGELLVFSASSSLTAGAQLGFVWHVPGERKFLILLQKLDLAACMTGAGSAAR